MKPIELFMIILAIVSLGLFFYWFGYRISEGKAIKIINKYTGHDAIDLANFGKEYLISWAKAIRGNKSMFTYNGANFDSKTGVKQ